METTSEKRDRLYNAALIVSLIFGVILALGMVLFKLNEDYLVGNAQFLQLMESVNTKEDEISYPKVNVKVNFSDGGDKCLIIPLTEPIDAEGVSVHDEFTENKYVITLNGYGENILDDINIVGDLEIMDAAGAYSQNGNVTVEAYCNDTYDYEVVTDDTSVTVRFYDLNDRYDYKAVIWTPYSEESRIDTLTFEDELAQFAYENGIKLYLTCNLENEYSQDDIVEFVNKIDADMVLGIDVENTADSNPSMTGICNTSYFIPDFDSARLSVSLVEGFVRTFGYEVREFEEASEDMPLVYRAVVPAAVIKVSIPERENEYVLTENVIIGIENTMNSVITEWRQNGNESE
jgi:hypothetical protein